MLLYRKMKIFPPFFEGIHAHEERESLRLFIISVYIASRHSPRHAIVDRVQ